MDEQLDFVRGLVHGGFRDRDDVVEATGETFGDDGLSEQDAEALVERVWSARVAEQAAWPATTDADRVLTAFAALDTNGIVARPDFACCDNCGHTEIGAEAGPETRGYVFFHEQDTARAVTGSGLYLSYGSLPTPADAQSVGREVAAALTAAGVGVEWNGSADQRIHLTPLNWQLRLTP
jgi:hypothetical protein